MNPTHTTELRIAVPPRWRHRAADPDTGLLLSVQAPTAPASGVPPRLTLHVEPAAGGLTEWRDAALIELADQLRDFELEDGDDYDLDGYDVAYRRYAHRVGGADLVCEEWSWLVEGRGFVLCGTVAREDYAAYCDVFEAAAATFDPAPDVA